MLFTFRCWLVLALWPLMLGWAQAQAPQVQQLELQRTSEALYLSARLALAPAQVVEDALSKGVPLYFVWQADVMRSRWYWADKRVASTTRILRLAYQPLTRRWRMSLSNESGANATGSGLQYALHQSFDSLGEALSAVGRVARWKIADASAIDSDAEYRVEFGFRLDLSLLPRPFQIGMGNQPEWTVELRQRLPVPPVHADNAGDTSAAAEPAR